jgi:3-dehydroquinate dehydratase
MARKVLPIPAHIASLAPKDAADAQRLVARVPAGVNAIEFRMDLAQRPIPAAALAALDPRPAILTWRSLAEGGSFSGSAEEYRRLVDEAYAAGATVDVEHARGLLGDRTAFPERERVVVSQHSPFSLPSDWEGRLASMREAGARAVKLVAGAADLAGGLRVAELSGSRARGRALSDGAGERPGRVCRRSSARRWSTVRSNARPRRADRDRDLLEIYEVDRPRPIEALFGSSRAARRSRSRRCCTTRSSARRTCRISTCRSRSRTSTGSSRRASRSIRPSGALP